MFPSNTISTGNPRVVFTVWRDVGLRWPQVNVVSNADIAATNTITEKPVMLGRTDPVPAVELMGGTHELASQELPRSLNAKQVNRYTGCPSPGNFLSFC